MARILIIRHGAFGDLVQSDGAIRDIRAAWPDAHISLLTTPAFRILMERCPHIDEVLIDARRPWWQLRTLWQLRQQLAHAQFTHIYDLQKSFRTGYYRKFFQLPAYWSGRKYNGLTRRQAAPQIPSTLAGIQQQLANEGIATRHTLKPDVGWMADDVSLILERHGVSKPYVALIPGCSARHPHKRWPYYAELATRLLEQGYAVVTAPGPDEIELARSLPGQALFDGDKMLNWFQLAGVLQQACFVIGNDTGPSHVAAHLGRPGLALFGPHTSAARTAIRTERFDALEVPDLAALSAEQVFTTVSERLTGYSNSA
ncbi:MAG: glycosyltransferase family 9 protein [Haliea sp.]